MVDWQAIVQRLGGSSTDFTLTTWDELVTNGMVIRLKCNCCEGWAQRLLTDELLYGSYYPDLVYAATIERLTLFLLEMHDRGGRNADRRAIEGSGPNTSQAQV